MMDLIKGILLIIGCAFCLFLTSEVLISEGAERMQHLKTLAVVSLILVIAGFIFHYQLINTCFKKDVN